MVYTILRLTACFVFKILFRFEVKGREHIPKKGGFILASNHISYLDPIALGVISFRKLSFMARHDLFCNPFFSWLLTACGVFPVKRDSIDSAALKEALRRLKSAHALAIFPEGRRVPEGTTVRPQAGIGFLAVKADVPVIPVFIKGTGKALPKGAKIIRPEKVFVYIGKQISIERRLPYQEIAQRIMENIRQLSCETLN